MDTQVVFYEVPNMVGVDTEIVIEAVEVQSTEHQRYLFSISSSLRGVFIMDETMEIQEHQQAEDDIYRTMFADYPDIVGVDHSYVKCST